MYNPKEIHAILEKVKKIEASAGEAELKYHSFLKHVHPNHILSAKNLLHYLPVRAQDLRNMQETLSGLAISSVSHSESYTLNNLQKVHYLLASIVGIRQEKPAFFPLDYKKSVLLLKKNSEELLGKTSFHGQCKVMVTLAAGAAENYEEVSNMIKAGMNIARVNTAHDEPQTWEKMIFNVKKAAFENNKEVKIYMDFEGPKMRTGNIRQTAHGSDEKSKTPFIMLYKGGKIKIVKEKTEGHGGELPVISITLPETFDYIEKGDRVWFDDGKLGGEIHSVSKGYFIVEITHAPAEGFKLKPGRGINFPDTEMNLKALTDEDLEHLPFIAQHADMVGYSFVQTPDDIHILQKHLQRLGRAGMGIILKIETHMAFHHLPALLFKVMQSQNCGVMIARGDLAVEIGYSRMAEVQEEIMWLAEAAHLPVIWATQVLENQVKTGFATRAEISDVVKSVRAECVMLNKGPYIIDAIKTVKDIDKRMASHEDKKRKILRSLHVAKDFFK